MRCKAGRLCDREPARVERATSKSEVATMTRTRPRVFLCALVVLTLAGCAGSSAEHVPQAPPEVEQPRTTPSRGVTYENPGINPPLDPLVDHRSTFSLDVDTGSFGIARRYLADGFLPDPDSVRVEEF